MVTSSSQTLISTYDSMTRDRLHWDNRPGKSTPYGAVPVPKLRIITFWQTPIYILLVSLLSFAFKTENSDIIMLLTMFIFSLGKTLLANWKQSGTSWMMPHTTKNVSWKLLEFKGQWKRPVWTLLHWRSFIYNKHWND